ncbi:MAG: Gfo/Idh/MocA family oxidoreductase [bacterium]|nr:Gfo/Idh/MocA family oxidoreductase [bacterium]
MSDKPIGIGVVGCGGFATFALGFFTEVPGVRVVAASDTVPEAAEAMRSRFAIEREAVDVETLAALPDVDVVYIATPPYLHHAQSMTALRAGKHVICEKPLAMSVAEADEMVAMARDKNLLLIANLMQRYNPLYEMVSRIIASGALGNVIHGFLENYAQDEGLLPDHWFWDKAMSGGIFIEHGVHFFDMFEGWLGAGTVESAQVTSRPGMDLENQVQCAVRYRDGVMVNFYHGFTQFTRMDRQEFRLLFERGDITLQEWVPIRMVVRAAVDDAGAQALRDMLPDAEIEVVAEYEGADRSARAHQTDMEVAQRLEIRYGFDHDKQERYGEILRAMMTDQAAWIRDPSHERRITEQNGYNSVVVAETADRLAR